MALQFDALPRAISLFKAGEQETGNLSNAAATTAAAFVSDKGIIEGTYVIACLDQRALPSQEAYLLTTDWRYVVRWIKELAVRGAPAIGVAGAAAVALAAFEALDEADPHAFREHLQASVDVIREARPTAVNLTWAVDRTMAKAEMELDRGAEPGDVVCSLYDEAQDIMKEDEAVNRRIGAAGAALLPEDCAVLTHCNAGSLATSFYGTALGIVYAAADRGKISMVYADETRPVCQGSRLTVWELSRAGVPVTLICDDMAAMVMAQGKVDAVIVGADRVAANGDVANKIGTLGVAVLARHFDIPFYVAAPTSTIDASIPDGRGIPIEERASEEVLPQPIPGVGVYNPSFDVTPAALITAIITERGAFEPAAITNALG